jgi:predicted RNA binding protein YcfA (HicA-like mRNA interferase family)
MKWSELQRKAVAKGWYLLRNGSRHDIYAHPDKDFQIEIERHSAQEVKAGLFHKLKRQIDF